MLLLVLFDLWIFIMSYVWMSQQGVVLLDLLELSSGILRKKNKINGSKTRKIPYILDFLLNVKLNAFGK